MKGLSFIRLEDEGQVEALELRETFTTMTRDERSRWPVEHGSMLPCANL